MGPLRQWFAEGENLYGEPSEILQVLGVVDAEVLEDGCPQIVGGQDALDGMFALGITRQRLGVRALLRRFP